MSGYRARLAAAKKKGQQEADAWNARHPVGTRVIAYPSVRPEFDAVMAEQSRLNTVTRSPAWVLGHGDPMVSVVGYAGGIRLDHIDVVPAVTS